MTLTSTRPSIKDGLLFPRSNNGLLLQQSKTEFRDFVKKGGEAQIWQVTQHLLAKRALAAKIVIIPMNERGERQHEERMKRLRDQEAENWAKLLPCTHIVPCLSSIEELEEVDGQMYLFLGFIMPYAEEGDLAAQLRSSNRMRFAGLKEMVRFLMSIASAVKFAHDVNVVHCDIKADNVLLFREGTVLDPRIMDFGMSLSTELNTATGGTPEYMPPERFAAGRTFSIEQLKLADIYSLGVLFYEIIVGARPFHADLLTESGRHDAYRVLHATEPPNLSLLEKFITPSICELIGKMLSKNPEDRPSAFRVVKELQSQEEYSIVYLTTLQESYNVIRKDTYWWNPAVHFFLGNHLHFYFLGGPASSGDREWLENNLHQNRIYGYSFHRVIGGVNYILRVWLKNTYVDRMEDILEQFQAQYGVTYTTFRCKVPAAMQLCRSARRKAKLESDGELLANIAACSQADEAAEFVALQRAGLVIAHLHAAKTPKIRFFITIKSSDRIGEWQRDSLADHFARELSLRVKNLNVYKGDGDHCLVLEFRLLIFGDLKEVIDALLACCSKARTERVIASFSTFVEVDERGAIESDDGSIIKEATVLHQRNSDAL